jgi:hypothetical protein
MLRYLTPLFHSSRRSATLTGIDAETERRLASQLATSAAHHS